MWMIEAFSGLVSCFPMLVESTSGKKEIEGGGGVDEIQMIRGTRKGRKEKGVEET